MSVINIKPLSINQAYRGRRFKTNEYKAYEEELLWLLPKMKVPKTDLCLEIEVGLSSKLADLDNVAKIFIDCLQKKYSFNDKEIYKIIMEKELVKKGEEYIEFYIYQIE